ncbi:unnamed protein product [Linum tenue]|uniref:Uncharacterized protein n=1 Tax=Linum tenue TaxID=586396 RepID=A0AAV0RB23_9ROSI|nr:unnamed protein product [Linum tenue]
MLSSREILNFLVRKKDARKILKRKDSDAGERGMGLIPGGKLDTYNPPYYELFTEEPPSPNPDSRPIPCQGVEVEPDVVVVDVLKLGATHRVELDGDDAVGFAAHVGGIEETQVLAGDGVSEIDGGGDDEGDAVTARRWRF